MAHPHPVPIVDDDDDFSDLDAEIAAAVEAKAERSAIATQQKRLAALSKRSSPDTELERQELLASIRRLEEGIVWHTEAAVALFHCQTCTTCGSRHRLFMGWMTSQTHLRDASCRRLLKGRPVESLPVKIEDHDQGKVELCADCVECVLLIDKASAGGLNTQE
jgi:hypothetical protein